MRTNLAALALVLALGLAPAPAAVETEAGRVSVEEVVDGLDHPWGMAFLPDGRLLVTERNTGHLYIVTLEIGSLSSPIPGTPSVFARGQGGLLDVALDPDFQNNGYVYLSYAKSGAGGAATALGRGRLVNDRLEGFRDIFVQSPMVSGANHFGGRIVFGRDGHLFLTMGERFKFEPAQDLSDHLGTLVRLNPDGSVPKDNPFVGRAGARPEIWTYGHRNIEAATILPESGALWIGEMGPRGGDELNLIQAGKNYGWPIVSWGEHYNGEDIPDPPTHPEFADAAMHWTPVISPSGMVVYTGDKFPAWQGSAILGSLSDHSLVFVRITGSQASEQERVPLGARIRDVEQGPDGLIYVLTDQANGGLWRLKPLR